MPKLAIDFYLNNDVVQLSRDLLGKVLMTKIRDQYSKRTITTGGIIIETEAYRAPEDKASHAYNNRRTKRTETMFQAGGIAYVYLCYGIHHLFNIVTGPQNMPHAILIRALQPLIGVEHMLIRRGQNKLTAKLCSGPGTLSAALGISTAHNASCLSSGDIWLEDQGIKLLKSEIIATPRIGIDYAEEYAAKPWRFFYTNGYCRD